MESLISTVIYTNNDNSNFFRKKYTTTAAFSIGLLLFLLPFVQLNCGSVNIAENTGLGLATGSSWNISSLGSSDTILKELNDSKSNSEREKMKIEPDWFLVLAIAFAVIGIVISISNWKMRPLFAMSAGILAALMLVAAIVHLKILIKSQIPAGNIDYSLDMNFSGLIKIKFTIWYYISLAAFLTAAFFSYMHHTIEMKDAIEGQIDFEFQQKQTDA
ncbi:MAG: hypothetical protein LH619_09355 [Chitinophagaceae bacterium]|nr:hypothetical protein [Chitinophagaceae bacterium]